MTSAIAARQLYKAYRNGGQPTPVLLGADLELEAGEIVAIVGPSGSGKSTLLHLLGGLDRPDSGEVTILGQPLGELDATELALFRNRSIGLVFQFHPLLPDFTALENVTIPGRIAGLPLGQVLASARTLLCEVGLEARLEHFPNQLSAGERQRVGLCRALLLEPPLLLADEPTGNLDEASGSQVLQQLLDLRARRGSSAVLVTHNPSIASRCGRVLRLERGTLHG